MNFGVFHSVITQSFVFKASVAIPVMQVVGRLVGPLTNFPFIINSLIEGYISIERYEKYIFGLDNLSSQTTAVPTESDTGDTTPLTSMSDDDFGARSEIFDLSENFVVVREAVFSWVHVSEDLEENELSLEDRISLEYITLGESGSTLMSPIGGGLPTSSPSPHVFGDPAAFVPRSSTGDRRHATATFRVRIPSLHVKPGECVAVIGSPGSGKSSLLLALLGEMPRVCGGFKIVQSMRNDTLTQNNGRVHQRSPPFVGYVSQVPWIPGGTIRSAILFGRPYVKERYEKVISACELQQASQIWCCLPFFLSFFWIRISIVGQKAMGALSPRERQT